MERASELKNVEFCHMHTEGLAPYSQEKYKNNFIVNSFFVGSNVRKQTNVFL